MFIALLTGATCTGFSGIFVRLADVGPAAAGFWRMLFAVPVLVAWTALEQRKLTTGKIGSAISRRLASARRQALAAHSRRADAGLSLIHI